MNISCIFILLLTAQSLLSQISWERNSSLPIDITVDSVVYKNLRRGVSYKTIADIGILTNITPWIDETFMPAIITILGNPGIHLEISCQLPEQLYPYGSSLGLIYMDYDSLSANWFDDDVGHYYFFNPLSPYTVETNSNGKAHVLLGGNPTVTDSAWPGSGEYIGNGRLTIKDTSGVIDSFQIDISYYATITITGDEEELLPQSFELYQNYPNPFNPQTQITYSVPKATDVTIKIYDVLGREIAVLVNERKQPGEYKATWNAEGLSSGVYFYRIVAGEFVETKKMVIIR